MELWGLCGDCDRWFYMGRDLITCEDRCPVCSGPATRIHDRGGLSRAPMARID